MLLLKQPHLIVAAAMSTSTVMTSTSLQHDVNFNAQITKLHQIKLTHLMLSTTTAATSVVSFTSVLWHTLTPVRLQVLLIFVELLLGSALLLRVVGVMHGFAVVVDVGQIVAELLTLAAVFAVVALVRAVMVLPAAAVVFAFLL